MPIRMNTYNDPNIGALFEQTAQALAPPAPGELASLATAGLTNQKKAQLADLFANPNQPNFDRRNIVVGNYAPTQSFYAQDQNNATTQRGQDIGAQTSITNNQNTVRGSTIADLFGPLNQGQIRPDVPGNVASSIGLPQLPAVAGAPKPLSETEAKGSLLNQILPLLTPDQQKAIALQGADTTNVVGANGQPEVVWTQNAVGLQPAYAPNATIMSDGLPKPPEGAVWKTGPDGKPVLDERGAPIAIPYQGGPLYQKQQAADQAAVGTGLQHDLVLDTIGTAIDSVQQNPNLTTGVGAQLTGGIGGGPANDVANTLNTIKANISFDKLQALRQASPTGGALGNVSDNDMRLLQATYGSLEQSQSAPQLLKNLENFRQVYYDTINGPGAYAKKQQADATALATGPALPPGVTEEDVQHTMQIHGLTREQVLARLGGT